MNKRYAKKSSALRMPMKFSYMTEEEAEYGGGGWTATALKAAGAVNFAAGTACFIAHWVFDCGNEKTMTIGGGIFCIAGIAYLASGIICKCKPRTTTPIVYMDFNEMSGVVVDKLPNGEIVNKEPFYVTFSRPGK